MKKTRLIREQLDAKLQAIEPVRSLAVPSKGWIRAIRSALGMSARQLASRLKMAQQTVDRFEKSELSGSASIKTMRRVAEGLDCVFVYGFIPRTTLDDTVRGQAKKLALKRLNQASHTMALEEQALSDTENREIMSRMIEEILNDPPSSLWEPH